MYWRIDVLVLHYGISVLVPSCGTSTCAKHGPIRCDRHPNGHLGDDVYRPGSYGTGPVPPSQNDLTIRNKGVSTPYHGLVFLEVLPYHGLVFLDPSPSRSCRSWSYGPLYGGGGPSIHGGEGGSTGSSWVSTGASSPSVRAAWPNSTARVLVYPRSPP